MPRVSGGMLLAWGVLFNLLGSGKRLAPNVIGSAWVQIPGTIVTGLRLAGATLVALWQAAHATGRRTKIHASVAGLGALLLVGFTAFYFWASNVERGLAENACYGD